jgi:hypothetical protein
VSPQKKRLWRTCLIVVAVLAMVSFCCLLAVGGIGYYLYASGQLDINQILSFVGIGPSEVQIINLSDGPIEAQLEHIDDETGESHNQGDFDLAPYDIASFRSISAGEYILHIEVPNGLPSNSTCALKIKGGGQVYRVVTVTEGTVIALDDNPVDTPEEMDITTSSLCRPQEVLDVK